MGYEVRGAVEADADCKGLASFSSCDNRAIVPFNADVDVEVINDFDVYLLNIVAWVDVLVRIGFDLNDVNTCCRRPSCIAAAVLKRGLSALEDITRCERLVTANTCIVADNIGVVVLKVCTCAVLCKHDWIAVSISDPNLCFVTHFSDGLITGILNEDFEGCGLTNENFIAAFWVALGFFR